MRSKDLKKGVNSYWLKETRTKVRTRVFNAGK